MSQESSGPDSSNISTTTSGQNRLKTPFVGENTAELRIGIFAKYCRIMNRHTSKPAISVQYVLTILNSAYLSATLSSMPILNSADFFVIMPLFTLKCTLPLPSFPYQHHLLPPLHPSTPLLRHQHHLLPPLHPSTPLPIHQHHLLPPLHPSTPLPLHQHHLLPPLHPSTPLPLHQHHVLPPLHPSSTLPKSECLNIL